MHHAQMCLFILFSILQNKQMVSKMLKNKVAYVMFGTKLYTTKLYRSVDTVCILHVYTN